MKNLYWHVYQNLEKELLEMLTGKQALCEVCIRVALSI